jgi:hypothetical protein
MKEIMNMEKPFSVPPGQIKLPGNEALRRFGGFFMKLARTKRAHGGTKSSGSGTRAVANRKQVVPGGPWANDSGLKRSKFHMLRLIVSELSGTWHKKGEKRGFTRVLVA